jgi:hypothetical protein
MSGTGYFVPVLLDMPVLSWVGLSVATEWGWSLNPSLGYVGQGTPLPSVIASCTAQRTTCA